MKNSRKLSIVSVKLTQTQSKSQEKCSHLGPVILHFVKNKKISQAELSRRVGVSRATVTNWIKGKYGFELNNLQKILEAFEINFLEFAMIANDLTTWGKFNPASKKNN